MDWKVSLDRYLTTPPDDGFDGWCEDVLGNKITDTFYNENENGLTNITGNVTNGSTIYLGVVRIQPKLPK